MDLMNNGTLVGSRDGIQMDPPKRRWRFHRECGENTWAPHRGAALPPPLFTSFIWEASLVGGNCGIQKCDSVDSLSLVIKCLVGEGHKSGDLVVPTIDKRPFPSRGQVNTHMFRPQYNVRIILTMTRAFRRYPIYRGLVGPNGFVLPPPYINTQLTSITTVTTMATAGRNAPLATHTRPCAPHQCVKWMGNNLPSKRV
jgi:hypothetical protein